MPHELSMPSEPRKIATGVEALLPLQNRNSVAASGSQSEVVMLRKQRSSAGMGSEVRVV